MTVTSLTSKPVPGTTARGELPVQLRSVPLRVPTGDGEAFDSWLEALARRNGIRTVAILAALAVPASLLPSGGLLEAVDKSMLRRVEQQCGLRRRRLDRAVLDRYAPLGWTPLAGSRYCPACLAGNGGRWPLRWRLPWVFACTEHHTLLLGRCPDCGKPPRRHVSAGAGAQLPGSCPTGVSGRAQTCSAPLVDAPSDPLGHADPLLAAQRWIDEHLDNFDAGSVAAAAALRDVHIYAAWISAYPNWRERVSGIPRPRGRGHQGRHSLTLLPAREAGAAAALAIKVTTAGSDDALRDALDVLFASTGDHPGASSLNLGPALYWTDKLPPAHTRRVIRAVDAQMAPLDRLRWRSTTATPQTPQRGSIAEDRARHVPQTIWLDWHVRLQPADGFFADEFGASMSRCLLVPGRLERNIGLISEELHPRHSAVAGTMLNKLCRHGHDSVVPVLNRLADYLDTHGSPIDYRRRRALIASDVLTDEQWAKICTDTVTHPGRLVADRGPTRLNHARRWVFTLLTGADLSDQRHGLAYRTASERTRYLQFTQTMTPALRDALHQHAHRHLHALGINEPLTWSPPKECCADLPLPGRDPEDINLDHVSDLVRRGSAPGAIADALATSIEHVRYALSRIDQTPEQPPGWLHQQQLPELLTREFFQREYVENRKSLVDIHKEFGYGTTSLARHAKRAGIELRTGAPPSIPIDAVWVEEQYLERGRPFYDIAAELGVSGMTVILAARRHGTPSRPPGLVSHRDLVMVHPDLAPDIRAAVEGQLHGWQRLRRFRQVMDYPSLSKAAPAIGAELASLHLQFNRLERDIGATLIHHAKPRTPTRLTDRGTALLAEVRKPHVEALTEKYGQPPRRKRQVDEKQAVTNP